MTCIISNLTPCNRQPLSFLLDLLCHADATDMDEFPRLVIYGHDKSNLAYTYAWFRNSYPRLIDNFIVYHGSSSSEHRELVHARVRDKGIKRVIGIFATCAFGTVQCIAGVLVMHVGLVADPNYCCHV